MNRQDFLEWLNRLGLDVNSIAGYNWRLGADAAYNLLSKEISEKDEEIAKLKKEFDVMVGNDSRQEQEIERLKNSQDVKVSFDAAKETVEKAYYWKQRCEAAENVVQSLLAGTDSDSEIENWNNWTKLKDNQL